MIGTFSAAFGLPLSLGIHQGLEHITDETGEEDEQDNVNLKTRIIQMAIDFAIKHNLSFASLDRCRVVYCISKDVKIGLKVFLNFKKVENRF